MKTPTDKQFQIRTNSARRQVAQLKNKVDEIHSWDTAIIGRTNRAFLQTAFDALKIAEGALLECNFNGQE